MTTQPLFEINDPAATIADCTSAIERNPSEASLYWLRAHAYGLLGNLSAATADVQRGLALEPDSTAGLLVRAQLLVADGVPSAALDLLNEAIHHNPDEATLYEHRAQLYTRMRRWWVA